MSTLTLRGARAPGGRSTCIGTGGGSCSGRNETSTPLAIWSSEAGPKGLIEGDVPSSSKAAAALLRGAYAGLAYVISGSLQAGRMRLEAGKIGWLNPADTVEADLALHAESGGARVILYAGKPAGEPLVQRGPFVAGSEAEVAAFYSRYPAGEFVRLSAVDRLR